MKLNEWCKLHCAMTRQAAESWTQLSISLCIGSVASSPSNTAGPVGQRTVSARPETVKNIQKKTKNHCA